MWCNDVLTFLLALYYILDLLQAVTKEKFSVSTFKGSLQDGVLLCKYVLFCLLYFLLAVFNQSICSSRLLNRIRPGSVKKIHQSSGTMLHLVSEPIAVDLIKQGNSPHTLWVQMIPILPQDINRFSKAVTIVLFINVQLDDVVCAILILV